MSINNFYLNLTMLGPNPTGLGIYSQRCAEYLERNFASTLVSHYYQSQTGASQIAAPPGIAIGAGRFAAIRRLLYTIQGFPRQADFIYSPTHHGIYRRENQIITIHDLIPIHHPQQYNMQYYYFRYILPSIVECCRAVFTVSDTAKADICAYYDIKPERVFVIPNGVDSNIFYPALSETIVDPPYLLVVGAAYEHKNIHELLMNWPLWKNQYNLKIVSARGTYKKYLESLIRKFDLEEKVEFLGYVTPADLVRLYQGCQAIVFPSLWEGFGIPPIEALSCGRPPLVSDIPVHKEVLGDGAIYITPGDTNSWQNAFSLLADSAQTMQVVRTGRERLHGLTWEKSGQKLSQALLHVEPELRKFIKER